MFLVEESLPGRALMLRYSQQSRNFARGENLSSTNDAVICYSWSRSAHLEQIAPSWRSNSSTDGQFRLKV
ncbi:hypothetical protein QYF36_017139 [Acer negundo]|nr:hypothetical protein QYF36_017139 [Acer negundo]